MRFMAITPGRVIKRSHIVDTATLMLILQPFLPQKQSHYEAASNPRLHIAVGRNPITQCGEASRDRESLGV